MKSMFKGAFSALIVVLALGALTATSAFASGAPIVETKPATAIGGTEATLNGFVNANGAGGTAWFEYGTTTAYGSTTTKTVYEKSQELNVSKVITALKSETYHFRIVSKNTSGTTYGADEVFPVPTEKPDVVLPGGKYTELAFQTTGGGGYLEWGSRKGLECEGSSFTGHFINSKELEGTMRWSACYGQNAKCSNEPGSEKEPHGWIQSETLKGTLGYINKTKKEVGVQLTGKSSEIWAKNVSCPGGKYSLTGSLGGQLDLPVNTKTKAFPLVYTENGDKQTTGELGGQLLWEAGFTDFAFSGNLEGTTNKEMEIQA
jgi:hypothetical protein